MPAHKNNGSSDLILPPNMSREQLIQRVTERVVELWQRELELEDKRHGKKRGK